MNHPGTANLYAYVLAGGRMCLTFRARSDVERDGESLCRRRLQRGSEIQGRSTQSSHVHAR